VVASFYSDLDGEGRVILELFEVRIGRASSDYATFLGGLEGVHLAENIGLQGIPFLLLGQFVAVLFFSKGVLPIPIDLVLGVTVLSRDEGADTVVVKGLVDGGEGGLPLLLFLHFGLRIGFA
jgi:hypothetical protein